MKTRATFERNALMSAAMLISDDPDARPFYVFCSIPGGKPFASFNSDGTKPIGVVGAPTIASHSQFKSFVCERFEVTP